MSVVVIISPLRVISKVDRLNTLHHSEPIFILPSTLERHFAFEPFTACRSYVSVFVLFFSVVKVLYFTLKCTQCRLKHWHQRAPSIHCTCRVHWAPFSVPVKAYDIL